MNTIIAQQLIEMARQDLKVREELLEQGKLFEGYHPDMERIHKSNAAQLSKIIDTIGYPTKLKVGEEASEAAWLIVQHAISEPDFMRRYFTLLCQAGGEVSPLHCAYLHDRICYFEGRPQRFGTQVDKRGLFPVENADQMRRLREDLKLQAHDPALVVEFQKSSGDLHQDSEFNSWRVKTGWI